MPSAAGRHSEHRDGMPSRSGNKLNKFLARSKWQMPFFVNIADGGELRACWRELTRLRDLVFMREIRELRVQLRSAASGAPHGLECLASLHPTKADSEPGMVVRAKFPLAYFQSK
jgi:hypothetical protein